ncbi:MAG: Rrf2 family transcriptional regulator [Candidatus Aadella gelida]|nr:Rrf2 family transcriptional regulator [Candidatus Aadella gelida]
MKVITKDTDYAINALTCITASGGRTVSVKELSEELGISGPFLRKILQILTKKGVLKSSKGKNGGFSIANSTKKITVLDVLEIFQGPFKFNEHKIKGKTCKFLKTCLFKSKIDEIESKVMEDLAEITIASLVR